MTEPAAPPLLRSESPGPPRRDEELVFNTRLVEPMLRYFRERFGAVALDDLLRDTDTPLTLLRDPEQWLSTGQLLRLSRAMVEHSGDALVTYRAGLELLHPSVLGPTWYVMRALGGPRLVYEKMTEFTDLSRITRWQRVAGDDRHVVLRFVVERGHRDDPLFCLNRQGALAGIPRVFDLPLARVAHPACIHEGASCCEYRVEWIPPPWGQGVLPWASGVAVVAAPGAGAGAALGAGAAAVALLAAYARAPAAQRAGVGRPAGPDRRDEGAPRREPPAQPRAAPARAGRPADARRVRPRDARRHRARRHLQHARVRPRDVPGGRARAAGVRARRGASRF